MRPSLSLPDGQSASCLLTRTASAAWALDIDRHPCRGRPPWRRSRPITAYPIAPSDQGPLTGRGRLSYRRAAEMFTDHTQPLDPSGRGWMLHQLRRAGAPGQIPEPAAISNAV